TEVLGLVKAQQVKNAVIVPVGSKGGFVLKRPTPPGDRDAFMAEGIACYKTFIRGLLDLTDNLTPDGVAPPHAVVRRDDNDPYLVVAADKGTATFSDIANGVAAEYGFWLGDAFASGGSQGYDHKGMGITARGAWESVKRHFREMGHDTQAQDFTVIGVGDMSGDVFGNGMLLSPHIRLLAAFNHLHIFIDPDPDPAAGFAERQRLFNLPRSTWTDYDAKLISAGGGVFERSAKAITLSPQIQNRFGILKDKVTPAELMRALLRADVDLLWFGGIGTYLKASTENHVEVGDRANDAIRIDAPELRCRVIGEGANLGLTQRSRIEAALAGVRLNTDFIDNSAGVDCSDHEVNIKILLDHVVANGDMTMKQRNALLVRMTDEVAELVLRDNYLQAQAITLVQSGGVEVLDEKVRLMRKLEKIGRLDRNVEFLPDDETLADRAAARLGLTRPEISVIISYAKIWLYDELLQSALPDDPHLAEDLYRYFPTPLQGKYKDMIGQHRLRREIIATRVTNSMINRVGGSFVNMLTEKTGMSPEDIARAYIVTREVYALRPLWDRIETLDNQVEAPVQTALMLEINKLIQRGTLWFLRNAEHPIDVGANSAAFAAGVAELAASLDGVLPRHYLDDMATRAAPLIERGVPQDLAMDVTGLVNMASGGDIVRLAAGADADVRQVARLYFAMGSRFRLGRLRAAAEGLIADTHWQKLAVDAVIEELYGHQLTLAALVLPHAGVDAAPERAIDIWAEENNAAVERMDQLLGELFSGDITDLSMIAVASRELRALSALARPVTAPAAAAAAS
ncbi:MAG: NAD-glutamate dehydrogenase, partial [Rhodobacterales bacterium]|nr:NAD-glutamate dehydrogenase [Rhodobacterales bacterium]